MRWWIRLFLHISSITLQEGVKPTISDRDFTIATIAPPTVMKVEEEKPAEDAADGDESAEVKTSADDTKSEAAKEQSSDEKKPENSEKK